jgi:uncharacterized repeat protein (TIGR02059 family)
VAISDHGDGNGSGVKQILYTLDGSDPSTSGTAQVYSSPISVSSTETLKAVVVDNVGNVSSAMTKSFTLDVTPPAFAEADLTGQSLSIHFDEPLDPGSVPDPSAFTVAIPSGMTTQYPTVNSVSISGSTVILSLGPFTGTSGTVSYTQPGSNAIQDLVGNQTPSFTPQPFDPDTTPPTATGASVDGTALELDMDEPLAASTPDPSAFTVTADGNTIAVSSLTLSGADVELTLASAVVSGQTVSLSYTEPSSNTLQDAAGNSTVTFTEPVTNNTAPAPQVTGGTVDGSTLTLTFSDPLASTPTPDPSDFAVSADGSGVSISSVSISGTTVTFVLASPVTAGQIVSVGYTQPSSNQLQDPAGRETPSFVQSATNTTPGTGGSTGGGSTPTATAFVSAAPADGSTQGSVGPSITLTANQSVTWSNVSIGYQDLAGDTSTPQAEPGGSGQTLTIPFSTTTLGLYTVTATISNGTTSAGVITHFTIWTSAGGSLPRPTAKTGLAGLDGNLSSSDNNANVAWTAADVPSTPGDGVVVEMAPQAAASIPTPTGVTWAQNSMPIAVTAHTILADTPVTSFSSPLVIAFPNAGPNDTPESSSDGGQTWHVIPLAPNTNQPAGDNDWYVRLPGGGLDVYTLHLTIFALVTTQIQQPQGGPLGPPTDLGGGVVNGQLVLRWVPPAGQIQYFSIWVNGKAIVVLGGSTFEDYLPGAVADDPRVFQIQAVDENGNGSPLSVGITGVPDLTGMTVDQAKAALAAKGLVLGNVGGAGGTIASQGEPVPSYASIGSSIDVTLGGALQAPLSLSVVGSKHIDTRTTHFDTVRIQVNQAATITSTLATATKTTVGQWHRSVKPGTWILRFALPKHLAGGQYKLTVEAKTGSGRRAATIRTQIKHGKIPLTGRARVIIVGAGKSVHTTLGLQTGKDAKVLSATPTGVYRTAFWTRNVSVIVVNIDSQGLALVHNLHLLFPDLKIVAITHSHSRVVTARQHGAAAVVVTSATSSTAVVSEVVRALLSTFNG